VNGVIEARAEEHAADRFVQFRSADELEERRTSAAAAIPHVRVDEDGLNTANLAQTLIQLDIGNNAAGKHQLPETRLLEIMSDVHCRDPFEHVLVGGRNIDLRELGRQHPGEVEIVAFTYPEIARFHVKAGQQHVLQDGGIAIGRETDNLAFVPARLKTQAGSDRFVERTQRMRELDPVQPFDLSVAADAHAAGQAGTIAVESDDQRIAVTTRVVGVGCMTGMVLDALQLVLDAELLK
jgi:hypothetical protein